MIALALAAGIAFADSMRASSTAALCVGLTLAVCAALGPQRPVLLAMAAVGIAFAAGWLAQASELNVAERHAIARAIDATVEARVCELDLRTEWLSLLLCEVVSPAGLSLPLRVRVRETRGDASGSGLETLSPGDRVRARLRLRPLLEAGNPGQRSRVQAERRRGIGAHASLVSPLLLVGVDAGAPALWRRLREAVEALRAAIGTRLAAAGPGGALLRALAIGDRGGLSRARRDEWVRLGISHLLAVSGLHLAFVAGLAYTMFHAGLARVTPLAMRWDLRTPALLVACVGTAAFALLAGWGVPVRRALVFLCALAVARLLGRATNAAHVLAAAALAVLCSDPAALFEAGAQLSFAASAALLFSSKFSVDASTARRSIAARIANTLLAILRTSATVTALTAPLLALHEMPVTSLALLANAIAVPITTLLLLPVSLLAALAACAPAGPGPELILALAEGMGDAALRAVSAVASLVAAPLPRPAPPALWALLVLGLGATSLRCSGTFLRVAIAVGVVGLLRVAPLPLLAPLPPRVVSFDVGLGDATLVQGRSGSMLVDGGTALAGGLDLGRSVVVPALRALGVSQLDLVVASHADADHRGGLPAVLDAFSVGELWLPPQGRADPSFAELLAAARRNRTLVRERGRGDAASRFGALRVTPLWPPRAERGLSRNDASLVLRVELAGRRVLLTGDIGRRIEARLLDGGEDLRADLLKVAHHGSRASSSEFFLDAVGAEVALVSAPCSVHSALPTVAAMTRLRAAGAATWWTGQRGAALVSLGSRNGEIVAWSWLARPRTACDSLAPVSPSQ